MEEEFRKGQKVAFFQGRKPGKGIIIEKLDDDQYIVRTKSGGGTIEIIKPSNELKAYEAVEGQRATIRFL